MRMRLMVLTAVTVGIGAAKAGQFEPPKAEVYIRAEDQQRARLLTTPCAEADVGRGCWRYDGRAVREAPCTYHIDAITVGGLPTDQCYQMERPRRYRGIWIDAFEGQHFIPEGTKLPEWPRGDPTSPGFRAQLEKARAAQTWLDVERVKVGHDFNNGSRRMRIDFIGRKTRYPGWYGHMGMSGNEIIVDRIISLEEMK